jgi:NAD(P)-dependent dehydrogenase (short-subunit alcohol dehydrogenase family)
MNGNPVWIAECHGMDSWWISLTLAGMLKNTRVRSNSRHDEHGPRMIGERVALVTGASSGIGFAVSEMLLSEGFIVTAVGRRADKLAAAASKLRSSGGLVLEHAADMSDESAVIEMIRVQSEQFGRIDVLVNNAGIGIAEDPLTASTRHLDLQIAVNLRAMIITYREARDLLLASATAAGGALVVNMASVLARHPEPTLAIYSATKAAVLSYTDTMNMLLAQRGVRSTAVCPGYVDTPMSDWAKDSIPADAMIPVSDVAEMVRALVRLSPMSVVPELPITRAHSSSRSGL